MLYADRSNWLQLPPLAGAHETTTLDRKLGDSASVYIWSPSRSDPEYQISAGGPVQQLRLVITLERILQIPQLHTTLEIGLDEYLHCTPLHWTGLNWILMILQVKTMIRG